MNQSSIFILKAIRKLYMRRSERNYNRGITQPEEASETLYTLLKTNKPCMIARFGSIELSVIAYHFRIKYLGQRLSWLQRKWHEIDLAQLKSNAGFFPLTDSYISRFAEMMLCDMAEVDILGTWKQAEALFRDRMSPTLGRISLLYLEPYWAQKPWSRVLENKKVLVIHPFAELIETQYQRHKDLFPGKEILPEFNLKTLKAVQSMGGTCDFKSWFEALEYMKSQMDHIDYDICLIGCGAYGFTLAAHAKRMGRQALHLGGALQLLFGIRGRRWDDPTYGQEEFGKRNVYRQLFNDAWVYPTQKYRPENANNVENGCYW